MKDLPLTGGGSEGLQAGMKSPVLVSRTEAIVIVVETIVLRRFNWQFDALVSRV